ncbi:MAG: hypothetical protein EOM83_02190 [Clostridia bacterium]|nr:hypothetical protein [Clostridia bacterium]
METFDISRINFDKSKHYSSVRMQQGRVLTDDDWNENSRIEKEIQRQTNTEVIGPFGSPDDGFNIANLRLDSGRIDFDILPGTMYLGGLRLELEKPETYRLQKDWLQQPVNSDGTPVFNENERYDLVFLEAWQQAVSAVEDGSLLEMALGGPDTTTRVRNMRRVHIVPNIGFSTCDEAWKKLISDWQAGNLGKVNRQHERISDILLKVSFTKTGVSDDLCSPTALGGYLGAENQAIRVQLVDKDYLTWGFDNAAPYYKVKLSANGKTAHLITEPKDQYHWPLTNQVVEILPWSAVLSNGEKVAAQMGHLTKVDSSYDPDSGEFTLVDAIPSGFGADWKSRADKDDLDNQDPSEYFYMKIWNRGDDLSSVAKIPITLGVAQPLGHTGLEITITGNDRVAGDYWVIAARPETPNRVVPWELEEGIPPHGVRRFFAPLALIRWTMALQYPVGEIVHDCRKDFPALTEICAEDICFDNSACELAEAETVQQAIDRLCKANNLRFHNKHLHGWGIVCGLQVYCGDEIENGRLTVKVKEGYALDCEGNDLVIQQDKILPIMEMIKEQGLLDGQDGEVCLTMGLNLSNKLVFNVEPYDPNDTSNSWKGGELIQNIYNNCLKPIVDFFTKEVVGNGEETALVGIHQKRITAMLNLLIQFLTPEFGQKVYISPQEDQILRELYESLKELLKSKTYCAMFDNVEQFPDYPGVLAEMNIPTIFSKGFTHTRIRVDHQSKRAYTVGGVESPSGSNMIFVFDLNSQQMVAELEIPGGTGIKVQDVAFSEDGSELYAIGMLNDEDTIFAVADVKEEEQLTFTWRPIRTFCDTLMVTLATLFTTKKSVYAIARGKGLYVIDPNSIASEHNPAAAFNASGQLVIDRNTHIAYATLAVDLNDPLQYNQIQGMNLDNLIQPFQTFFMGDQAGSIVGEDDIEIAHGKNGTKLCVVSNAIPGTSGNKNLLVYNITANSFNQFPDHVVDLGANTDVKLVYNPVTAFLMVVYEDSYRVRLVSIFNTEKPQLLNTYHHPVQIYPESIAMGPSSDNPQVFVYNWVSNTFNIIPANRFQPEATFPLEELTAYRNDVLEAYIDLFSKLSQYLKDCICDQFLLKCPTCDEEDKLYLACVSIRENQVYKVCNFAKRKYVKSFPAFDYWLSWIPFGPILRKAVESVCCAVLPDLFENVTIGGERAKGVNVKGTQVKYGVASFNNLNFNTMFKERKTQASVLQNLAGDWLGNLTKKQVTRPERTVKQTSVVGKPVDEVKSKLENANIEVTRVETFDPLNGPKNLMKFTVAPTSLKENERVILFEENGKVKYYALEDKEPANVEELRTQINTQKAKIEEVMVLQNEVSKLRTQLEAVQGAHQNEISSRDKQIEALQKSVTGFSKISTDFESLRSQVNQLSKTRIIPPRKPGGEK